MFADFIISGYMLVALNTPSVFPLRNTKVLEPDISAKAALVFDIKRDRVLFERAGTQALPMASLTKLLSSMVVLDALPLDKVITLSQEAIDTPGDAGNFIAGERVEAKHLLFASLIQSSNDAMMALAYDLGLENFLSLMRSKAIHLGLKKFKGGDPAGLSPKMLGSPFELLDIARAAFTNEFIVNILSIPEYTFRSSSGRFHKLVSTNDLIFDSRIIAAKTGYLEEAGQNYASLVKAGGGEERIVVILLGSANRKKDMLTLLDWLDNGFSWR